MTPPPSFARLRSVAVPFSASSFACAHTYALLLLRTVRPAQTVQERKSRPEGLKYPKTYYRPCFLSSEYSVEPKAYLRTCDLGGVVAVCAAKPFGTFRSTAAWLGKSAHYRFGSPWASSFLQSC